MNSILKGGFILAVCALVTKIIGAFYRIPLTNLLGTEGIGIYQTVFPFYSMLLTLSSTGIPNSIAKLIAEGKNAKKVVYKSVIAFGSISILATIVMVLSAKFISNLQGNPMAKLGYIAISPSVFIVSILSVLRGYFQGKCDMKPTGISQVIEQVVKLIFGLTLIKLFAYDKVSGAFFACLAVTISEVFALTFIVVYALKKDKHIFKFDFKSVKSKNDLKGATANDSLLNIGKIVDLNTGEVVGGGTFCLGESNENDITFKQIFKVTIPITLTSIMLPLCRLSDSFLVINLLSRYTQSAVSLYGIYQGAVESIIGVPVALCYGLAVAGLPVATKTKGEKDEKILLYTVVLSILCAVATLIFSNFAINLLYGTLSLSEKQIAIRLLKISAMSVVLLPIVQSTSIILVAKNRLYIPSIGLFLGLIAKIIITLIFVSKPNFHIYGTAFSDICCYFVAGFFNLVYIIKEKTYRITRPIKIDTLGRNA